MSSKNPSNWEGDLGKAETLKQTRGAKMVGAPTHVAHCSTIGGTTSDW